MRHVLLYGALGVIAVCGGLLSVVGPKAQVVPQPGPPTPIACAYNTSPVTLTDGQAGWVQCNSDGTLAISSAPVGTQDVNLTEVAGGAVATGNGTAAGALRVALPTDGTGVVVPGASAEATAASTINASSALAANLVVKASAGNLYGFQVSATSTLYAAPWWIMVYNATSAPSDGAVTPAKCYAMPTGVASFAAAWPTPARFGTGIVIGVSTNGCFTKAAATQAFISADYQ